LATLQDALIQVGGGEISITPESVLGSPRETAMSVTDPLGMRTLMAMPVILFYDT
jgi:hypothetical protein